MNDELERLIESAPRSGFYYHYKHDPEGAVNNYAYEVVGLGHYTEEDLPEDDRVQMEYRPLYPEAFVYRHGKLNDHRPLRMWLGSIEKEGKIIARFARINDPDVIQKLEAIRHELYGS